MHAALLFVWRRVKVSLHLRLRNVSLVEEKSKFSSGVRRRTTEIEKMQPRQTKGGLGRPSGTDGSDYSYRMTVDERYQKAAQRKSQLYRLLLCQASCQVLGLLWGILVTLKGREANIIAMLAIIIGFVALLCGEIGRRQSNSKLLKFYLFTSPIATTLCLEHAKPSHLLTESIRDLKQNQDRDSILESFDTLETWRVLVGLLVQIIAMLTTFSLLKNMSPKRAS